MTLLEEVRTANGDGCPCTDCPDANFHSCDPWSKFFAWLNDRKLLYTANAEKKRELAERIYG